MFVLQASSLKGDIPAVCPYLTSHVIEVGKIVGPLFYSGEFIDPVAALRIREEGRVNPAGEDYTSSRGVVSTSLVVPPPSERGDAVVRTLVLQLLFQLVCAVCALFTLLTLLRPRLF